MADIRLITFDLDETLWPLQPTLREADRAATCWLSERVPEYEGFVASGGLAEIRDALLAEHPDLRSRVSRLRLGILNKALLHLGLASEDALKLAEGAFNVFLHKRQQVTLFPGMQAVLERLSRRFLLGTLTNGNASLERIEWHHPFSFSFSAESVARGKPHPDMFLAALAAADVLSVQCIHIGDSLTMDIEPAQALGMHTIWANYHGLEGEPGGKPDGRPGGSKPGGTLSAPDAPPRPADLIEARSVQEIEPCIERIVLAAAER